MSQIRKDEIARNMTRINDTLEFARQMMDASKNTVDPQIAAIIMPTFSALFGLIAGMASDLNEINERLANPPPINVSLATHGAGANLR
jgi:hypothetical protein